jgi:hypothetical protein
MKLPFHKQWDGASTPPIAFGFGLGSRIIICSIWTESDKALFFFKSQATLYFL